MQRPCKTGGENGCILCSIQEVVDIGGLVAPREEVVDPPHREHGIVSSAEVIILVVGLCDHGDLRVCEKEFRNTLLLCSLSS